VTLQEGLGLVATTGPVSAPGASAFAAEHPSLLPADRGRDSRALDPAAPPGRLDFIALAGGNANHDG